MTIFALLLFLAAVGHAMARALRLPVIPVLLALGIGLNLTGFVPEAMNLDADPDQRQAFDGLRILELGLAFLVFASGVELNPRRFTRQRTATIWVSLIQFIAAATIGFFVASLLGFDNTLHAVYLGLGLAASSTLVGLRQLRSRRALFEPFGRMVTGVLLVQDVAMILLIVLLASIAGGYAGAGFALGFTLLLGGGAWIAQRHLIPWLINHVRPDEETLLLWIASVLFLFAGAAHTMGLPIIAGAFFAGFAFSSFPLNGLVRGQLTSLVDFFLALFFVTLGALIGIPGLEQLQHALMLSALVVIITPPLVTAVAEWCGLNTRSAIESGLILSQTSEFSLLLGLSGLALGHINQDVFITLALTTIITMTLTPFISTEKVAHALLPLHPLRRRPQLKESKKNHVLMLGFGSAGMWIVKPLREQGYDVLVVDDDAIVHNYLTSKGIPCMRGDGSDEEVLRRAGARDAKLIIISMRRVGDALNALKHIGNVPAIVRVLEDDEAQKVEALGGIPVLGAKAAAETFLRWFDANDRITNAPTSEPTPPS